MLMVDNTSFPQKCAAGFPTPLPHSLLLPHLAQLPHMKPRHSEHCSAHLRHTVRCWWLPQGLVWPRSLLWDLSYSSILQLSSLAPSSVPLTFQAILLPHSFICLLQQIYSKFHSWILLHSTETMLTRQACKHPGHHCWLHSTGGHQRPHREHKHLHHSPLPSFLKKWHFGYQAFAWSSFINPGTS